jgi:hypothetical protein
VAVCLPLAETMTGAALILLAVELPDSFSGLFFLCPEVGDVEFDDEVEEERWPIYESIARLEIERNKNAAQKLILFASFF